MNYKINTPLKQFIANPFYTDCFFESDMMDIGDTEANENRVNTPREKAVLTIKLHALREKKTRLKHPPLYN